MQLRARSHNMTLINKTKFLNNTDFIVQMLYIYSYLSVINHACVYVTTLYCEIAAVNLY